MANEPSKDSAMYDLLKQPEVGHHMKYVYNSAHITTLQL